MPWRIERANGEIVVRFAEHAENTATFGSTEIRKTCAGCGAGMTGPP